MLRFPLFLLAGFVALVIAAVVYENSEAGQASRAEQLPRVHTVWKNAHMSLRNRIHRGDEMNTNIMSGQEREFTGNKEKE